MGQERMPTDGTVTRVLHLLECFAEAEDWTVSALAKRLGLPLSTTHRLLNLCRNDGFVSVASRGTYRPGLRLYRLGSTLTQQFPLRRTVVPLLKKLAAEFDETALLTLIDRTAWQVFFAAKAEPSAPMRYMIEINRLCSPCWGATGRSILANLSEAEIDIILQRAEPSPVDGRAFDPADLRAELAEIRRSGFSASHGQRTPEGVAKAVPFFDAAGQVVGSLAVTTPAFRYQDAMGERLLARLREMAAEVSHALGHVAVPL